MNKINKKIILTGGGTAGSVTPLLAVAEAMPDYDFLWVGTKDGPEKGMVVEVDIKFQTVSSGKLRRYWSIKNLIDPFKIIWAFFQSIFIILKYRPALVISAGAFVSVPFVWAAWFLSVPVLIHQQDARPGLANRLMAPFAKIVTVTFEKSLADYGKKAVWVGNPVRQSLRIKNNESQIMKDIDKYLPVILVVGGGTGAVGVNNMVADSLEELTKFCQIIHIAGVGKKNLGKTKNYFSFEFLPPSEMAEALQVADIVVTRAGMGLATEVSLLGKPTIFIPMPNSHQEDNARIFADKKAAIVLDQKKLTSKEFIDNIKRLIKDKNWQDELSKNIHKVIKTGGAEKTAEIIKNVINNK